MNTEDEKQKIQAHIAPDLEYVFRDVANVFVGQSEVVMEFGNLHRSVPGHATVSNRIVISVANAYELQQSLANALAQAQQQLQNKLNT